MTEMAGNDRMETSGKSHPDASLLTAFIEESLTEELRAGVMHHLVQCQDCRRVLVLATPEVTPARIPAFKLVFRPTRPWYQLRWAAVAAGVTILAATSMLIRTTNVPDLASTKHVSTPVPASGQSGTKSSRSVADSNTLAATLSNPKAETRQQPQSKPDRRSMINTAVETNRAPSPSNEHPASVPFTRQTRNPDVLGGTPSPVPWMLGDDGALYQSFDNGRQWRRITIGQRGLFRSISPVGRDVWVLGSDGTLLRSLDAGTHWTELRLPLAVTSASGVIVQVEFRDALHGVITNSEGRRWFSSDGGQTWH